MTRFICPYLSGEVELTDERKRHIQNNHPDLLPEYHGAIADTLYAPDQVRESIRFASARMFSRWFDNIKDGKHVVVVVVSDVITGNRHWIITAYIARKLAEGGVE